jgi:hypothetical protein
MYYRYLEKCMIKYKDWRCGSDQVVFTEILKDYPLLFYKISIGCGENIRQLYKFV